VRKNKGICQQALIAYTIIQIAEKKTWQYYELSDYKVRSE